MRLVAGGASEEDGGTECVGELILFYFIFARAYCFVVCGYKGNSRADVRLRMFPI